MGRIKFIAHYGDVQKVVDLSIPFPDGVRGLGVWHLKIANYHQGIFIDRGKGWTWDPQTQEKDDLTSDDIEILIDMIIANTSGLSSE